MAKTTGMKKVFIPLLLISPFMWSACTDDMMQELMDREKNYVHLETVTSDKSTNVYFEISDSGQTTEYHFGDDGSYINTPNEIKFTVHDNISGSDDVVVDNVSELMWTKCTLKAGSPGTDDNCAGVASKVIRSTAISQCEDLTYAGYSDWRLPSAPELFTLVNFNIGNPAIDETIFPGTPAAFTYTDSFWGDILVIFYWTIDTGTVFGTDTSNWVCGFDTNHDFSTLRMIENETDTEVAYVRCIRGQ
ncbi:MAG TPA: DUF1566 domain-containing protein [Spirochaetota bacterium]|nr:DUF1566 domain-containing protein [Spirochaetota bacterium]